MAAFAVCLGAGVAGAAVLRNPAPFFVGLAAGLYCLLSIKVVRQWEKVAVLRLGRYIGLRGPGMFWIIPIIDTLTPYVDQRVRVTSVSAESTLTRDTVPTNVDAIVFWLVWNAEKSLLEVADFADAITHERANGVAGIDRPARTGADDLGARDAGPRIAARPG